MKAVIISDTHFRHKELIIPEGDIIIHSGDFGYNDITSHHFLDWFSSLDFKYRILVAGNHDAFFEEAGKKKIKEMCMEYYDTIYLEDEMIEIEGLKIYGSPWTVLFRDWHFMKKDEDLEEIWKNIPDDTNILITHGPQKGVLDILSHMGKIEHLGSSTLANRIAQLKDLKYHIFGHIHGEAGIKEPNEYRDYVSINASMMYEFNQDTSSLRTPIEIELI